MTDLAEAVKRCTKCKADKPLHLFRMRVMSKPESGRRSRCNQCDSISSSAWYQKNKERVRNRCKNRYQANKKKYAEYTRKWRESNISRARQLGVENRRKLKYGVDKLRYNEMLLESGGCCGICREPFGSDRPNIDHDHSTGVVRELLCRRCNHGLGNFRENPALFEAAVAYLNKHGGK